MSLSETLSAAELQSLVGAKSARLVPVPDSSFDAPAVFHRDTALKDVARNLHGQQYVLATDDTGHVSGLAAVEQIRWRLDSRNDFERSRWQEMPLAALISVEFCESARAQPADVADGVDCVALTENNQLFGISFGDDIFLSLRRVESLLSIAFSDPLTALPNRMAYERRLQEEWNRAARTGASVGIIVIDLDDFKDVNDTHGHQAGDLVLTTVAHRLEACMRSYDLVARLGGDEFVSLCLGCRPGMLAVPVRRLQKNLADINLSIDGVPVQTTASIGAAVRHSGFDESDPADLFAAADQCLYRAKESPETNAWMVELGGDTVERPHPVTPMSGTLPGTEFVTSGRRLPATG